MKHSISENDLEKIVSDAKQLFAKEPFPVILSKRELDQSRLAHFFLLEAFIGYLNNKGLLNKEVNFDTKK